MSATRKLNCQLSVSGKQRPQGIPRPKGDTGPQGPKGDPGIVTGAVHSFNDRQGDVTPQFGDYTLGMVGGEILSNSEINEILGGIL